jgi:hypothetical protein
MHFQSPSTVSYNFLYTLLSTIHEKLTGVHYGILLLPPKTMSIAQCCLQGFQWDGTPTGKESTLTKNNAYITGSNPDVAIVVIPDLFGWTFLNQRLLADHYAREADATVFVPDL